MEQYNLMTPNQINQVFNNFNNINELLCSSGIYSFVKQNGFFQQAKSELSNLLTSYYEKKDNEKFHKSLNFFEKLGFMNDDKIRKHQEKIGFNKSMIAFTTDIAFLIVPFLLEQYKRNSEVKKIKEFVIGWIAYINKENNPLILKKIEAFYSKIKENFMLSEYNNIFEKYANCNIGCFPSLIDANNSYSFFNFILSCSDLSNQKVNDRIKEFGYHWLNLSESEVSTAISTINDSQEYLSDISTFTAVSMLELFNDLAQSINHSKQYSNYCIDNDIWALKRIHNRKLIEQSLKNAIPIALSGLSFYTNNIVDSLLIASTPIINNLLNNEINLEKAIEIQKRIKTIKGKFVDGKFA